MLNDVWDWFWLISELAFYRSWWFLAYLILPVLIMAVWWGMAQKKTVDTSNAWSETGRHWAAIGWAGIIASVALYMVAALWLVPNLQVGVQVNALGVVPAVRAVADAAGVPTDKRVTIQQAFRGKIDRKFMPKLRPDRTLVFVKKWYPWLHALPVTVLMCGFFWLVFTGPGGRMAREETDLASAE